MIVKGCPKCKNGTHKSPAPIKRGDDTIYQCVYCGAETLEKNLIDVQIVFILVTGVDIAHDTAPLYGDVLAVFEQEEDAEIVRGKIERGEEVDFIDTDALVDYDELAILVFSTVKGVAQEESRCQKTK